MKLTTLTALALTLAFLSVPAAHASSNEGVRSDDERSSTMEDREKQESGCRDSDDNDGCR